MPIKYKNIYSNNQIRENLHTFAKGIAAYIAGLQITSPHLRHGLEQYTCMLHFGAKYHTPQMCLSTQVC